MTRPLTMTDAQERAIRTEATTMPGSMLDRKSVV